MNAVLQYIFYLIILVLLAIPLGSYIAKVMNGEKVLLSRILNPIESRLYRIMRVSKEEMTWKRYAFSALSFSALFLIMLTLMLMLQGFLPMNPQKIKGMSWDLAFNTAVSFVTNTNWQSYSGEIQLSYFSQMLGLTVQNFVSAAVGLCGLFALIRGFNHIKERGVGNFWVDITKSILYILLPLSIMVSLLLVSQGVIQNFNQYKEAELVEEITTEDGTIVSEQAIPGGPAASQIAIKQLGTNGGGFFGVNSAHPMENPTPLSNMIQMLSILLIPVSLCFSFGKSIKDKQQGNVIFIAMMTILIMAMAGLALSEQYATPQLISNGQVDTGMEGQAGGNMEGKESRFGIASSVTWGAFTTAASNGSVNSMHDSYTPLGGMIMTILIMLGEVVFGGVGCGLYGMIGFVIFTVFIAGLMVGRTPEYLGKKIEPFEMKMAVVLCLATPVAILIGSTLAVMHPDTINRLTNSGPHGFSEVLYAYTSAGGNNGSAFAGFATDTVFLNLTLGLSMLFVRFIPITAVLAMAGSFAGKKKMAATAGTLSTTNGMFIFLLVLIVLLVGALSFFPALSLGPIAEHLMMAVR